MEDFLEHQLGFAVGIDRALRQILRHRHPVGRAVGGAGGAEDEFLHAAFHGGIGELERVDDVVVKILFRVGHGFADERVGGEVHDGVGLGGFDGVENVALLLRLAQNEFRARIHRRAMAFGEVVINRDLMAGVEQFFRANGTDVAGAAGDKNVHAKTMEGACGSSKSKMESVRMVSTRVMSHWPLIFWRVNFISCTIKSWSPPTRASTVKSATADCLSGPMVTFTSRNLTLRLLIVERGGHGRLRDFVAAQDGVLDASGHVEVDLDIGGEIAGQAFRVGQARQSPSHWR